MSDCSKIISEKLVIEVECVFCKVVNYLSFYHSEDPTNSTPEAVTCWACKRESLIGEDAFDMFPDYPDESVDVWEGKSSPD